MVAAMSFSSFANCLILLLLGSFWTCARSFSESVSTSSCFATPPGTSDRSASTVRLAWRDWTSHDLSTFVTEILLKEYLNYNVIIVDATSGSTSDWGPEIVAGDYDLDMEQWQISSSTYSEYVTRDMTVLDLGAIGYPGRGGIFIAGSDALLAADKYSDFYLFYQDASVGISAGLPQYGEIDIKTLNGDEFPVCNSDWCSTGGFEGYYVPPQCEGVLSDPTECFEIVMVRPTWDAGYFEQLTTNWNLKAVHGYYAGLMGDVVKDRLAEGKPSLFYRWTPDPLVSSTNGLRLSYPDYYVGCAAGDTRRGDGPVACDYPETTMRKLGSAGLSKLPEAMYMLQSLTIDNAAIEGMLSNHTATGGPYTGREAACVWIKSNPDLISTFAPSCISQPLDNPQTGDLVFDEDALECVATTVYPKSAFTYTCLDAADRGSADRSDVTVKIGMRGWTSIDLSAMLTAIILKDLLGYKITMVDLSHSSTSAWGTEITNNLFDYDAENWQTAPGLASYKAYMEEAQTVLDLGEIGYGGRGAMWTFKKTLDATPLARYYKFWMDSSDAFAAGYPAWKDIDMEAFLGSNFPICTPEVMSWCPTGTLAGYWAPEQCETTPSDCAEFLMASPTYDTAYFEQLTHNLGLKVIHGYYTMSDLPTLVKERYNNDLPTVFWWWEPDPIIGIVGAERISYPDYSYGCDSNNDKDADDGTLACDYPETAMLKLGSTRLPDDAPQGYYFLTQFQISPDSINTMLSLHVDGGGSLDTQDTACQHLKENWATYKAYAPDCISNPKVYPNVAIGDTIFDADDLACEVIECPAYQILASDGTRVFCQNCSAGLVPSADQSTCQFCASGTSVNAEGTSCVTCAVGTYAEFRGLTACEQCSKGSYMDSTGATACELCAKGEYQDEDGQTACKSCSSSMTTDSRGMSEESSCRCPAGAFLGADNTNCQSCPEGMECAFGSEYAHIAQYAADNTLVIPEVLPGYYTLASDPLSVYLCDSQDEEACPGGPPSSCGNGRIGLICEVCPKGQALGNGKCKECSSGPAILVWVCLPVGLLLLAWALFNLANDKITANVGNPLMFSVLLGLVITTAQSLALFPALSVEWRSQGDLFDTFRFFLGTPDGVPLSCALSDSPAVLFAFRCLLPLLCVVAIGIVWSVSYLVCRMRGIPAWPLNVAQNTLGQLLQTLFIAIGVLVVQPLRCYSHPNGLSSMSSFPQILCWEDSEHTTIVIFGILVGISFVIPFLTGCIWAVISAPHCKNPVGHYQRWRFLLYRFRADVWWWGVVFLIRQLALAFSACVPADSPHWQITYVALVTIIYLSAVCTKWPWKNSILNIIDVSSMLLLNAVIVSSGSFTERNDADVHSFVVFHFVLISFFMILVISIACSIAHYAHLNGLRGGYTGGVSAKFADKIANSWIGFIEISSKMSPETIKHCIETFNEYDVHFLSKCMASFQSIDAAFGSKSASRLNTISHSSKSIEDVQAKVKISEIQAKNESTISKNDNPNLVFV